MPPLSSYLSYINNDIYKCDKTNNPMAFKQKENYTTEDEEKVSRINSAGIINVTLENLWKETYQAMAKADLVTWNRKLDAIWCILGGDVKDGEQPDKDFNAIDLKIHETGALSHNKVGFGFKTDSDKDKSSLQYVLLRRKSLFLRRLQNSQGKGTAYATNDEDDFD